MIRTMVVVLDVVAPIGTQAVTNCGLHTTLVVVDVEVVGRVTTVVGEVVLDVVVVVATVVTTVEVVVASVVGAGVVGGWVVDVVVATVVSALVGATVTGDAAAGRFLVVRTTGLGGRTVVGGVVVRGRVVAGDDDARTAEVDVEADTEATTSSSDSTTPAGTTVVDGAPVVVVVTVVLGSVVLDVVELAAVVLIDVDRSPTTLDGSTVVTTGVGVESEFKPTPVATPAASSNPAPSAATTAAFPNRRRATGNPSRLHR